jgi:hypothetical protein
MRYYIFMTMNHMLSTYHAHIHSCTIDQACVINSAVSQLQSLHNKPAKKFTRKKSLHNKNKVSREARYLSIFLTREMHAWVIPTSNDLEIKTLQSTVERSLSFSPRLPQCSCLCGHGAWRMYSTSTQQLLKILNRI